MSSSDRWLLRALATYTVTCWLAAFACLVLAVFCAGCDATPLVSPSAVVMPQTQPLAGPVTLDLCEQIRSGAIKPLVKVPACDAKEQ
jgi:hypothetical protein